MAALTTINAHLGQEEVEIAADFEYMGDSPHRYWFLEVKSKDVTGPTITVFLSPKQLETVASQLREIVGQLDAIVIGRRHIKGRTDDW